MSHILKCCITCDDFYDSQNSLIMYNVFFTIVYLCHICHSDFFVQVNVVETCHSNKEVVYLPLKKWRQHMRAACFMLLMKLILALQKCETNSATFFFLDAFWELFSYPMLMYFADMYSGSHHVQSEWSNTVIEFPKPAHSYLTSWYDSVTCYLITVLMLQSLMARLETDCNIAPMW